MTHRRGLKWFIFWDAERIAMLCIPVMIFDIMGETKLTNPPDWFQNFTRKTLKGHRAGGKPTILFVMQDFPSAMSMFILVFLVKQGFVE